MNRLHIEVLDEARRELPRLFRERLDYKRDLITLGSVINTLALLAIEQHLADIAFALELQAGISTPAEEDDDADAAYVESLEQ